METEDLLVLVFLLIYSVLAIRWGYRFVDGRWEWLEKPNHKVIKIICAVVIGYVLSVINFLIWIIKFVVVTLPKLLS